LGHLLYAFPSQLPQQPVVMLAPGTDPLDRELDNALEGADGMRHIGFSQRQAPPPLMRQPQAVQIGFSSAFFICTQ
jgi:hypothetical protein